MIEVQADNNNLQTYGNYWKLKCFVMLKEKETSLIFILSTVTSIDAHAVSIHWTYWTY